MSRLLDRLRKPKTGLHDELHKRGIQDHILSRESRCEEEGECLSGPLGQRKGADQAAPFLYPFVLFVVFV